MVFLKNNAPFKISLEDDHLGGNKVLREKAEYKTMYTSNSDL